MLARRGATGRRVVTARIGTLSTLVRERVSMSAVTDIPGRKASFSVTRIFTWNFVASVEVEAEEAAELVSLLLAELATSVTTPLNFWSLNESTSKWAFWPTAINTTSTSPTSTRASMVFKSAMVMISVPAIMAVPTTRSPSWELSLLTVPSRGE